MGGSLKKTKKTILMKFMNLNYKLRHLGGRKVQMVMMKMLLSCIIGTDVWGIKSHDISKSKSTNFMEVQHLNVVVEF